MNLKKTLLAILILTLSCVSYLKANKFVNLDEHDANLMISQAIETKELQIPGYPNAYNPSIISFEDGYLLSFRVNSYNLATYWQKLWNHRTSFLGVVQLNKQFELVGKPQLIDVRTCDPNKQSAPQDARLFLAGQTIYAFFNDYAKPVAGSQELFVATLVKENGIFQFASQPKRLQYRDSIQKVEKNWSPFTYQDKLYVSYSVAPHTILEVDPKTGVSKKVDSSLSSIDWNFGPVRGGTPSLQLENGYLSFFHSCKLGVPSWLSKKHGRVYFMGAYFFDSKPPFAIKKITPGPLADRKDYHVNNPKKVIYPGGIAIDGEKIHIVWGQSDARICVSTFEKAQLLSSMIACEEENR